MSGTLQRIVRLIGDKKLRVSAHALQKLVNDGILIEPLIDGISGAVLVQDYPDYFKGPAVLVLQIDENGMPIHLVWGLPAAAQEPAVLVTAYRPDPSRWTDHFSRRIVK
ncbi:DUF4258 domain-containing protein [Rhizobium sp. AG855]|uniref:DUF4258 domain-containing protein n=1 Tax=Rhizobium sp. AG855 TaxID=2183898 RepID=UPI000E72E84D|nr:DUF4258 domain-containing protein [Rhizobium sp. AG855]RKE84742.1 hypothetical protein DFO46_1514 [Rhizobium sp. AG855]